MGNAVQKATSRSKGAAKPEPAATVATARQGGANKPAALASKEARAMTRKLLNWLDKHEGFTPSNTETANRLALYIDKQFAAT